MTRFPKRLFICPSTSLVLIGISAALGVGVNPSPLIKVEPPAQSSKPELPSPSSQGKLQDSAKPERLSPYEIESLIEYDPEADLRDVWAGLGIKGDGDADSGHLNILQTCHECQAQMFEYDLDGEPGKEILLRVEDRFAEACRYLIFKQANKRQTGDDWKLLGYIDHDFGRYNMPEHAFVVSGGRTWLLIEFQGGSGSGFAYYWDGLFRVTPGGVKRMLDFSAEGSLSPCYNALPTREFSSHILNCEEKDGKTTVEVEFAITYYNPLDDSNDSDLLWSKTQRAIYRSDGSTGGLKLDTEQSTVSEEEFEEVYECEGLSYEAVLENNIENLAGIATGNSMKHKEWLRQFLRESGEDTPETKRLQRLLGH